MNETVFSIFNYVDLLILGTVVLCFTLGLVTGFVWQVAGIVAIAIGVLATLFLGPLASEAIRRWIADDAIRVPLAYLSIFSIASMAVRILATVFSKLLERWKLQKFNKLLGAFVGAVKGLAISAVVVVALSRHSSSARDAVEASRLGWPVCALADWVMREAKDHRVPDRARESAEELRKRLEEVRARGLRLAEPAAEAEAVPGETAKQAPRRAASGTREP